MCVSKIYITLSYMIDCYTTPESQIMYSLTTIQIIFTTARFCFRWVYKVSSKIFNLQSECDEDGVNVWLRMDELYFRGSNYIYVWIRDYLFGVLSACFASFFNWLISLVLRNWNLVKISIQVSLCFLISMIFWTCSGPFTIWWRKVLCWWRMLRWSH